MSILRRQRLLQWLEGHGSGIANSLAFLDPEKFALYQHTSVSSHLVTLLSHTINLFSSNKFKNVISIFLDLNTLLPFTLFLLQWNILK